MRRTSYLLLGLIFYCVSFTLKGSAQVFDFETIRTIRAVDTALLPVPHTSVSLPEVRQFMTFSSPITRTLSSGVSPKHVPDKHGISTSCLVGEIPLQSSVSPMGAVTYTIPIECAPGREGVVPQISIVYNSMGGSGVLGAGWAIGGPSAIQRMGSIYYYDNTTQADDLSSPLSNLTLDGIRLIPVGKNLFEPEQGHIKVERILSPNNIVKYFKVSYPNGSVGIFGYENNMSSRLVYPLTKLTDAIGRSIEYVYELVDGYYYISQIKYGASKASPEQFASIVFSYKNRPDVFFNYIAGQKITEKRLLDKIECRSGTTLLRSYLFTYELQTESLLKQVDCSIGDKKLNPLIFYYGSGTATTDLYTSKVPLSRSFSDVKINQLCIEKGKIEPWSEDDGLIIYPWKPSYFHLEISSNMFRHSQNRYINYNHPDQVLHVHLGLADDRSQETTLVAGEGFIKAFTLDIDQEPGDEVIRLNNTVENGKDVVRFKIYKPYYLPSAAKYFLKESKEAVFKFNTAKQDHSKNWSITPKEYITGDFTGDGRPEVFAISRHRAFNENRLSMCYLFDLHNSSLLFEGRVHGFNHFASNDNKPEDDDILFGVDYNGDGKTEICHIHENGTDIWSFRDGYFIRITSINDLKKGTLKDKQFLVGDINGDGKTDFLLPPPGSYWLEKDNDDYDDRDPDEPDEREPDDDYNPAGGEYIDNGNEWTAWFGKGAQGYEKKELNIINHNESRTTREQTKYLLQDMNGDGKADLVVLSLSGYVSVHRATNGGISSEEEPTSTFLGYKSRLIPSVVANNQYHTNLLALTSSMKTIQRISFTRDDSRERLLTGAVNSLGVTHKVYYQRINGNGYYHYEVSDLYTKGTGASFPYENYSGPLSVCSRFEVAHNGTLYDYTSYRYTDAIIHKQGLGFRGFRNFTVQDKAGRQTVQTFDPYRFSLPLKEENAVSESSFTHSVNVAPNKKTTIRLIKKTVSDKLNGNSATLQYVYDAFGNCTKETIDIASGLKTVSEYSYINQSSPIYLVGLPKTAMITKYRSGASWVEKAENDYYENTLTKAVRKYVGNNKVSETQFTYDASGNVVTERTSPFNSGEFLERSYSYDSKQLYLLSKKDEFGKVTNYSAYTLLGKPTLITDFKSNKTSISYDEQGRTVKEVYPDGTINTTTFSWGIKNNTIYSMHSAQTGTPGQTYYFDAFKREVQATTLAFGGALVSSEKEYDTYGRPYRVSEPHLTTSQIRWIHTTYDSFDRVTQVTYPTGKTITHSYGKNTEEINDAGTLRTIIKDATGAITKITDAAGSILYTLRPDGQPSKVSITVSGNGQLTKGGPSEDNNTEFSYDPYGRQIKTVDPSAGTLHYAYDARGNLNKQTDALGRVTETVFDKYGRPVKTTVKSGSMVEMSTSYSYNSDDMLAVVSGGGKTSTFSYDNLLRHSSQTETANGLSLTTHFDYEAGKITKVTYSGMQGTPPPALEYVYSQQGFLTAIKAAGTVIKKINAVNHHGQTTHYTLGNGVTVSLAFDANKMPTEIKTVKNNSVIQHFSYAIDAAKGIMNWRRDNLHQITEEFSYDTHNRLTKIKTLTSGLIKGPDNDFWLQENKLGNALSAYNQSNANISIAYSNLGNITFKSDAGELEYNIPGKPFAVSNQKQSFGATPPRQQDITYNGLQRPATIAENNFFAIFTYGYDAKRHKMEVRRNNALQYTRYYLGDCYEKEVSASGSSGEKLYFGGSAYNADVVYTRTGSGAWNINYIHRDHLGSITAITDGAGVKTAQYSYDAWGRLRNPVNQQTYAPDQAPELLLGRGFTGHEHLPAFGLINMNARLYDPVLGRFLMPDPVVQAPHWSQNFNRYSYCVNNPLMYVDENGEVWWFIPVIAAAVFAVGNTTIHLIKGDIKDIGGFFKYFGQGAITGFVLGCAWQFAPALGGLGKAFGTIGKGIQIGMTIGIVAPAAVSAVVGLGKGIFEGNWEPLGNAFEILLGNTYTDENKNFFGGLLEGFSRGVWQLPQTIIGNLYSQGRNIFTTVRVDHFGGATFVTREGSGKDQGVSIGNFININIKGKIKGNFDEYVIKDQLFMHEYGHYIDSQLWGPAYLFGVGIPSIISAMTSSPKTHNQRAYERRANRKASHYFYKHYGYKWENLNNYPF